MKHTFILLVILFAATGKVEGSEEPTVPLSVPHEFQTRTNDPQYPLTDRNSGIKSDVIKKQLLSGPPATVTVVNTNHSGPGSLRQAIADAPDGSTIDFSVIGTITLTSGQLEIVKNLTIAGPGAHLLSISGNLTYSDRVFLVDENVTTDIGGITIKEGCIGAVGGGIASLIGAHLTIRNAIVTGNCNPGYGAGIANWGGTLIITDSLIFKNQAFFMTTEEAASGTMRMLRTTTHTLEQPLSFITAPFPRTLPMDRLVAASSMKVGL